jgi:hypothetical protein
MTIGGGAGKSPRESGDRCPLPWWDDEQRIGVVGLERCRSKPGDDRRVRARTIAKDEYEKQGVSAKSLSDAASIAYDANLRALEMHHSRPP